MERDRYLQERQAFAGPAEFEAVVILLERDRHNFRAGSPICLRGIRKRVRCRRNEEKSVGLSLSDRNWRKSWKIRLSCSREMDGIWFSVRKDFTRLYFFVCFSFIGGTWIESELKKFKLDLEQIKESYYLARILNLLVLKYDFTCSNCISEFVMYKIKKGKKWHA